MTEFEWYGHQAAATLTVRQLREKLDLLPDDAPVLLLCPEEVDGSSSTVIGAVAVERRSAAHDVPDALVVVGSFPSGSYQRARRRQLTVTGLPIDDSDAGEGQIVALQQAVGEAIKDTGHRGGSAMSRDLHAGSVTWTWVHGDVPTDDLVEAATRAVESLNPGNWHLKEAGSTT